MRLHSHILYGFTLTKGSWHPFMSCVNAFTSAYFKVYRLYNMFTQSLYNLFSKEVQKLKTFCK